MTVEPQPYNMFDPAKDGHNNDGVTTDGVSQIQKLTLSDHNYLLQI